MHCEFTIIYAKTLWIRFYFPEFTIYSLSFSRLTIDSLSVTRIHYRFIIFFVNPLSFLRIFFGSIIIPASSLRIHYPSHVFSWIHYKLHEFNLHLLSFLLIHYDFTFLFANSLWNNYQFHESPIYSLSFSRLALVFCAINPNILFIGITVDVFSFS